MTDHSILLSDPAIRQILAGRKTETRHPVKPQPKPLGGAWESLLYYDALHHTVPEDVVKERLARYACKYRIGDRLWVKEDCCAAWKPRFPGAWAMTGDVDQANGHMRRATKQNPIYVWHKLDQGLNPFSKPWTIGTFMPRWASRITLTVTDVRVQRICDMSKRDFKAEGFARDPWIDQSDAMHGKADDGIYAWANNPWVFATRFSVRIGNIDNVMPETAPQKEESHG
jgi:hypothetical protein